MKKKIYVKPDAERVAFYTNEEITAVLNNEDYTDYTGANDQNGAGAGGTIVGGSVTTDTPGDGWID